MANLVGPIDMREVTAAQSNVTRSIDVNGRAPVRAYG